MTKPFVVESNNHPRARAELLYVLIMLGLFFCFNLATSTRFPLPWQDEDQFTDVAANFALGQGFVSSVWTCGDHNLNNFFACNVPLFPYVLGEWIRVFGFTISSARSLNYLLISGATFMLWLAIRRLSLVSGPRSRLLLIPLLLVGYGLGINYRSARYDCLGILIACGMLLAFSIPKPRLRMGVLAALGLLLPFAGLQLVCFAAIIGVILLAFLRLQVFKELTAIGCGIVIGGILLCAFYAHHGALHNFIAAVHSENPGSLAQRYGSSTRAERLPKDPSLFLLYFALLVVAGSRLWRRQFKLHSTLGFAVVAGLLIPLGMIVLGKFTTYYTWMAYIPVVVAICANLPKMSLRTAPLTTATAITLIILGSLMGAPLQMASAFYYWHDRRSVPVESLVSRNIGPQDWVYTDYAAYFAVRKQTRYVFIPFVIPSQYRDKITVMVLPPGDFDKFAHSIIGGEWYDTGDSISSTKHDLVRRSFAVLLQRRNDLKVYKRRDAGVAAIN